ncbi:unnamed protein product [Schistosoma margrebowiei]|uniref:CUB domain-containing protein n=1 Tax=Schistosoma margrebowiei TaxID=48269 RepID=A0A3P8F984_9TREM|nr:unnamed protein product [Schistosoma margrebowiei]
MILLINIITIYSYFTFNYQIEHYHILEIILYRFILFIIDLYNNKGLQSITTTNTTTTTTTTLIIIISSIIRKWLWWRWYHYKYWKSIILIYIKWIIYMDLLILLFNLNKIESNLMIMKSNLSFNNNISINLYHNNNHIKNQYIIDHHQHHDPYNKSNIQIIHKIKRRSHSKQSEQQQQQPITNYYEPEEILSPDYTLPYQDIKCMEFIQSTEIKYIKDSSSMLNGFFGMSNLPKRTIEYSFQTPNYPAPYPLNIECIKVIAGKFINE